MDGYPLLVLVHPCDATTGPEEWRAWLAEGRDFGQLVAGGATGWPLVVPTHFVLTGQDEVLVHLARPNPIWPVLRADPRVVLSVVDDYAYVPTSWRAARGAPAESGVPTSYYAAVQLRCSAQIVDDPDEKADLLHRQLEHFQPDQDFTAVSMASPAYARLLPAIRGLRLRIVEVTAKFKYDDHKPAEHRQHVAAQLQQRDHGRDLAARAQQLRRLHDRRAT